MVKTVLQQLIETYEGYVASAEVGKAAYEAIKEGSIPFVDQRIAEYKEVLALLKAPNLLDQLHQQLTKQLEERKDHYREVYGWYANSAPPSGTIPAIESILQMIENLQQSVK